MHSTRPTGTGMTSSDQIARHARKIPDAVALRFGDAGRTYRELDERLSRLANALLARGVSAGDRVAVLGLNGIEVVEAYHACGRLGAICVPINFRLVADEVAYALTDSGAVAVVVDAALAPVLAKAREQAPEVRTVLVRSGAVEREDDELRRLLPRCQLGHRDVRRRPALHRRRRVGRAGRPGGPGRRAGVGRSRRRRRRVATADRGRLGDGDVDPGGGVRAARGALVDEDAGGRGQHDRQPDEQVLTHGFGRGRQERTFRDDRDGGRPVRAVVATDDDGRARTLQGRHAWRLTCQA